MKNICALFILSVLTVIFFVGLANAAEIAYIPFLPDAIRADAVEAISQLDLSESALENLPSVKFTSEESLTSKMNYIVNRVHSFPGARFDIWFMAQSIAGEDPDPAHWNKLMIVLDKAEKLPKAYYLEFGKTALESGKIPSPSRFTAACFTCHASGPTSHTAQFYFGIYQATGQRR